MAKLPTRRSSSAAITGFIQRSKTITHFAERQARLIFAIDATASRQPTWDSACRQQASMFNATSEITALTVQLCFYRGYDELRASRWLGDTDAVHDAMRKVRCQGGHTQIGRLLKHARQEHRRQPVRALVFIGDAVEEAPDSLCASAGECGMLGLPLFLFQEGRQPQVEDTFRTMARLSGGAYARFDQGSAERLAQLLGAVARYATGGRAALENQAGDGARILLDQLNP